MSFLKTCCGTDPFLTSDRALDMAEQSKPPPTMARLAPAQPKKRPVPSSYLETSEDVIKESLLIFYFTQFFNS